MSDLLYSLQVLDAFSKAVAILLPDAARSADVELALETKRAGDPVELIAAELAVALVQNNWVFVERGEDAPQRRVSPDHLLIVADDKNPACSCGFAPRFPDVPDVAGALLKIQEHLMERS